MKFKTSELSGQDLNEAVAIVVGPGWRRARLADGLLVVGIGEEMDDPVVGGTPFEPGTDWALAGPIIERERISVDFYGGYWGAMPKDAAGCEVPDLDHEKHKQMSGGWYPVMATGDSALVAAMRAFVLARMGDEVDL